MIEMSEAFSNAGSSLDPKLQSLASAADDLADMIATETQRLKADTEESPKINTLKDLTATVKSLAGIIRDLNDLPTYAEREARELARLKLEHDKTRHGEDSEAVTFVLGEGTEELSG